MRINQVVQTVSSYQGPAELKLSTLVQDPVSGDVKPSTPAGGPGKDGPVVPSGDTAKTELVVAGFPIVQDPQKLGVEIVEEAEVEGTICDCGFIAPLPGGFPKWPLLFLTAVPLAFIDFHDDCENCNDSTPTPTPTPTPPSTPTPTPTPVPEPASLLLFGTGLLMAGAGLRRRRNRNRE